MEIKSLIGAISDAVYKQEDLLGARKLCESFLLEKDNPYVWRIYADVLLKYGEELSARAIFRNIMGKVQDMHIKDIILARNGYCKPIVNDNYKVIYYYVPKCASSSIKDYFAYISERKTYGNTSHFRTSNMSKILPFSAIREKYSDYYSFVVIRHPILRLRAYYKMNIIKSESLKKEAGEKELFYDLSTSPSYEEILNNFSRYRQVFHDFRHHTDEMMGYVGIDPENVQVIYNMNEIDKIRSVLSARSNIEIPHVHNMKSDDSAAHEPNFSAHELEVAREFYREEIRRFFSDEQPELYR